MKTKEQIKNEIGFGEVYTIMEFLDLIIEGYIIPYDGIGYFHDGNNRTDKCIWNEKLFLTDLKKYPYVCWYNK